MTEEQTQTRDLLVSEDDTIEPITTPPEFSIVSHADTIDIVRAKRLGWDEGLTGNVTNVDILDPYDYPSDDLQGEHVIRNVTSVGVGPYTQHLVGGQVADPNTIFVIESTPNIIETPDRNSTTVSPATLSSSGGVTVTQVVEPEVVPEDVTPEEDLGGKPNKGTAKDKRLKQNKMASDPEPLDVTPPVQWRGVIVVEGTPTGDGREFAPDAIEWADMPLPLRWQKVDSHGGMATNETVRVGNITRVWRDGSNIMGEGYFDLGGPEDDDAHEAYRRMGAETLTGVSIDADDITDADIEYVFPEPDEAEKGDDDDDLLFLLFAMPEKIIFHAARVRAATLCDIPAFVEAQIHLIGDDEVTAAIVASVFSPVLTHDSETSDGTWNAAANEKRLPALMPTTAAKKAYAWLDNDKLDGDKCPKTAGKFIHHEVNDDGTPGAANLTACASGIGIIDGSRGGASVPDADRRGVYDHLAKHLRDGGREPPPFEAISSLVAHAWHDEWRPPREWFTDPKLGQVMPIVVTDQGRVYGHAAQWGQCHLGYMSECVMPPHEDYHAYYLTGEVPLEDGTRIAVGQITAGIEHAALPMRASSAKQHYENTDAVVADVIAGNDAHGIWVAGAIRPWAQTSRVAALRASGQVSPDWRRIGGALRMVALLTVNTSGYTVPRARSLVSGGEIQTLISSGMITVQHRGPTDAELDKRALRLMQQALHERVHGKKAS